MWPERRRRCWIQAANVWYLIPTNSANFTPLIPLRSNSAKNCSRWAAGVRTRRNASVLRSFAKAPSVVVDCRWLSDESRVGDEPNQRSGGFLACNHPVDGIYLGHCRGLFVFHACS